VHSVTKLWGLFLLITASLACVLAPARAATREYEIKAGFIYNFFRFIEWPTPGQSWTVGILGSDPFEGGLRDFEARPVAGKTITIKKVTGSADAKGCDVVYVGPSESTRLNSLLNSLKGSPVLTISDLPQFADKGGAIGLTTESNRVRFIVNIDTLKQGKMRANARFLQLASRTITASDTPEEVLKAVSFSRPADDQVLQDLFGL
jgi:hypothetical protein